jgi:hypothetical protein
MKTTLLKALNAATLTIVDGYEVENCSEMGDGAVLCLADERMLDFDDQDIEVDDFGMSSAVDDEGIECRFEFQVLSPLSAEHLKD